MPKKIENVTYFYMGEVATSAGRTPQTIRRWIRDEKVTYERKYEKSRNRLLFTNAEKEAITSYATGISNGLAL